MSTYQIFKKVVKATGVHRVIIAFVVFFMLSAGIIMRAEPQIERYGDACWYCFSVISTCGFGDITVTSTAGRVMSVLLSIFAVVVIAMLVGVVVNLYSRVIELRMHQELPELAEKMEHLSELSKEELDEISQRIRQLF